MAKKKKEVPSIFEVLDRRRNEEIAQMSNGSSSTQKYLNRNLAPSAKQQIASGTMKAGNERTALYGNDTGYIARQILAPIGNSPFSQKSEIATTSSDIFNKLKKQNEENIQKSKEQEQKAIAPITNSNKLSDLQKQQEILKSNIEYEKDIIKNNKTYIDTNGNKFTSEHYKKALKYDIAELEKIEKQIQQEQKKNAKENKTGVAGILGYLAKKTAAGAFKGITNFAQAGETEGAAGMKQGEEQKDANSIMKNITSLISSESQSNAEKKALLKLVYRLMKDDKSSLQKKLTDYALDKASAPLANVQSLYRLIGSALPKGSYKEILKFNDKISEPSQKIDEKLNKEGQKYGKGVQTAGETLDVVGNMFPSILVTTATKDPSIGLATMGVQAKGAGTMEALRGGEDLERATKIGTAKGEIEIGTEMMTGGLKMFGKGAFDDIGEKGISKITGKLNQKGLTKLSKYVGKVLNIGKDVGGEQLEETVSDVLNTVIDKNTYNPDAKYTIEDWGHTMGVTAASTLVLNVLTGGLAAGANRISRNRNNQTQNVQITDNDMNNAVAEAEQQLKTKFTPEEKSLISEVVNEKINKDAVKRVSLSEQLEKQGTRIMEQAIADENSMIENFKTYLEENNIQNPTQQDIDNSLVDLLGYDNEQTADENAKTEKKYNQVIQEYLKERESNQNKTESDNDSFNLKQKQLDVIKESNPMHDDYHTGIRELNDIKTAEEAFKTKIDLDEDYTYPDFTQEDGEKALQSGKITVYSSYPIEQGVFVTPSKMMAQDYAGNNNVYSKEIDINNVAWINSTEGQYAEVENNQNVAKNEQMVYNKDVQRDDFSKALSGTEWRKFYQKIDNHGIESKQPGSKNITFINDKIILSEHDGTTPNIYDVYQSTNDNVISNRYGLEAEDIIQSIYEIAEEENIDERKVQKVIQDYFEKGLLGRYDSNNNLFIGKEQQTRTDTRQDNRDSREEYGRRKDLPSIDKTNRELDNSSFSNETKQQEKAVKKAIAPLHKEVKALKKEIVNLKQDNTNEYSGRFADGTKQQLEQAKKNLEFNIKRLSETIDSQEYGNKIAPTTFDERLAINKKQLKAVKEQYKELKNEYTKRGLKTDSFINEQLENFDKQERIYDDIETDDVIQARLIDDNISEKSSKNSNKNNKQKIKPSKEVIAPLPKESNNNTTTENTTKEKAKKLTRKEVRQQLLKEMDIDETAIASGKDISSMNYQLTDPIRVNEKVFGRELGKKINEATVEQTKHNTAEKIRWLNQERTEIKELGIKARSKESAAVQKYGEKQYVNKQGEVVPYGDKELMAEFPNEKTQKKIKKASEILRNKYDQYIDQINGTLEALGYDPIPKRKDYMRHFSELGDVFSQTGVPFNLNDMKAEDLPTDINGLTEFNKPGKNWFASSQKRYGVKTNYDAITGIDGYLEGASNLIFHTEDIQRYRALSTLIRETYGQTKGFEKLDGLTNEQIQQRIKDIQSNKLSKYVAWLDEQANNLAGKKGAIDRGVERVIGRRAYTVLNTIKKQTGSNMTGFNVRSAMTNFISSTIASAKTNKIAMVKGTAATIRNMFHNDGFINKSDFLTSRFGSDMISNKMWQKASNAGQMFMTGSDYLTANIITRSKYYEGLHKGMTETQAIKYADDFAARVMGDRSQGATAEAFNSKTLGILTQFQLEVNNQWQYMLHDAKMDFQSIKSQSNGMKAGATIVFQMGQLAAFSYFFNELFEKVAGSRAAFDPIEIIKELFGTDDDDDKTIEQRTQSAISTLLEAVPFASLFTSGGRLPISEMLEPFSTTFKAASGGTDKYGNKLGIKDIPKSVAETAGYYLLPTGYSQLKKTTQGLSMFSKDKEIKGSYTDTGKLRFPVKDTTTNRVKSALFGRWASEEAREYMSKGLAPLNDSQTAAFKKLYKHGISIQQYRDYKKEVSNIVKSSSEYSESKEKILDTIKNMDVPDEAKYILYDASYNKNNPFNIAQKVGIDVNEFLDYESQTFKADKDKKGNSISGSKKEKVVNYINSMNIDMNQKAILYKLEYKNDDTYNERIINYLNDSSLTYSEKKYILEKMDFKVKSNGKITWD